MSSLSAFLVLGLAATSSIGANAAAAGGPPGFFGGRGGSVNQPSRPGPSTWRGAGQSVSPAYNYIFQMPLPIPAVAQPQYTETKDGRTINYYSSTIQPFTSQVYPNLGPAHLVGYNGTSPGPTYIVERNTETIIRYLNNGEETAAVHLHGSYTHAAWDGWAADEIPVGSYKDYYYPNQESARAIWYHDHAEGHTAADAYYGQAGIYIIHDPAEDSLGLPKGKYDVPLAIADKSYQSNGDLVSPNGSPMNFFGDTIHVNDQPWPYLAVEPRKYRFRLYDMSLSRPYDLYFADKNGNWIEFQVIASDSGLFGGPVTSKDVTISMGERYEVVIDFAAYAGQNITLGNNMQQQQINEYDNTDKVMRFVVGNKVTDNTNNGAVPSVLNGNIQWPAALIASDSGLFGGPVTSKDVTISMGERYEVVIDFAAYAGQNITLGNNMQQQQINEYDNTDKVMRFVVGNKVTDNTNNGAVPSVLNGNIQWPAARTTVDHSFNFQMGGESMWTINGVDFNDANNRVLARPPQGTVELWELHHTGGPAVHPVHVHLVNMQVVSRTGGSRGLLPYETAGLKDVVLLEPGETVRVLASYGPWNGVYMCKYLHTLPTVYTLSNLFLIVHCHNLIHEDNTMLAAFNVTALNNLGYDFSSTQQFADPLDSRFSAQVYDASKFTPDAIKKAVDDLAALNAYQPAAALLSAESNYYATAGYHGDAYTVAQTTTVPASSSGFGFATTTATASLSLIPGATVFAVPTHLGRPFVA
nr:bilirubin oxidase [Quercus suber]